MREIGRLPDEAQALLFSDVLVTLGIDNEIERGVDGSWVVWGIRDESLVEARTAYARFMADPANPGWAVSASGARRLREQAAADAQRRDDQVKRPAERWRANASARVTILLIVLSIAATLACDFGQRLDVFSWLTVNGFSSEGPGDARRFTDVMHGQIWRLVTPVFVHMSGIHILFNMMWIHLLGRMIEQRQGPKLLALLVLAFALASNSAQYLQGGPVFGGMSGVNYGLFGYVWIRGMFDRSLGFHLGQTNVLIMIIWFVACYAGMVPHVANTAHGAGLVLGMAWGALSAPSVRRRFFPR